MPGLRDEITKTFRRLSGRAQKQSAPDSRSLEETVVATDLREGRQYGTYKILRRLGSGGMGHVYLAIDTRLGRHAALKFLSPKLKSDPEMLARLQQEARTASSLNHPNILTIYDIDEAAGEPFIASEFVDGYTLRQALERGLLDRATILDLTVQIASALRAAHEAGVVHRDLKPGNIMVRPDGLVKLIDFGLAKFTPQGHFAPRYEPLSDPDSIGGTIQYMSPEQARGEEVDHRSDVWSLGVILYEMLAQRKPFEGETESHVIVAILDQRPADLRMPPGVTAGLARVAERALSKDAGKRYQSALEMLEALRPLQVSSNSRPSRLRRAAAVARTRRRRSIMLGAGVGLIAVCFGVWWWGFGGHDQVLGPNWVSLANYTVVTHTGDVDLAAISPDGKRVAYSTTTSKGWEQLHLLHLDTGREFVWPAYPNHTLGITFSPDNSKVYYTVHDKREYGHLYSAIEGANESIPVLEDVDGPINFSSDGSEFAFRRRFEDSGTNREAIFLVRTLDTGEQVPLLMKYNKSVGTRIAWSNHNTLAVMLPKETGLNGEMPPNVLVLSKSGKELGRYPLPRLRYISGPAWINNGSMLIMAALRPGGDDTAAVPFEVSTTTAQFRIFHAPSLLPSSMTVSRDFREIAALTSSRRSNLWVAKAENLDAPELWDRDDSFDSLAWNSTNSIVHPSPRAGDVALWETSGPGQDRQLTHQTDCMSQQPAAVPASPLLVFISNCGVSSDQLNLWSVNEKTGQTLQLTEHSLSDQMPVVAPDGDTVLFNSWANNSPALIKLSLQGRSRMSLTTLNARNAAISPDGRRLACEIRESFDGPWRVAVLSIRDGSIEKDNPSVPLEAGSRVRWSPDGTALDYVDARDSANVWRFPLDGSLAHALTHRQGDPISDFAWNPDGTRIAWVSSNIRKDVIIFHHEGNP
jgi:Tol biopolymer transport system component/predicted Ser/Thr protein kinase